MKAIFNLFKPAPHIPKIQDSEVVRTDYRYWRIRILYSMFIGYSFYYFTRKSFTFAVPGLIEDLNFDKSQIGLLGSILYITYGISKFAGGVISDQSNPRYFMAFGLMMTGILNICFGMSSVFWLFALFWGLNGVFQGCGWLPCARLLTQWYSQNERGTWWSICNVSHNVGAFTITWIAGMSLYFFDWRMAMYIPGVLCIFGGLFLINRLRDTPQSLGLPVIEEFRNDYGGVAKNEVDRKLTTREILVDYVFKNKYIWLLAVAYLFIYVVRIGVIDWAILFLTEQKGYSVLGASACVSLFEVGGFCGNLCAGWASDRIFKAKRGPVNLLFTLGMLMAVVMFWCVPMGLAWMDSAAMFCIGFTAFGPQMLIGVAAAELSHKNAAATAVGFAGCFSYVGAALAGYPLGMIAQEFGWGGYFLALASCCAIAAVLLAPLWGVRANPVLNASAKEDTEEKEASFA